MVGVQYKATGEEVNGPWAWRDSNSSVRAALLCSSKVKGFLPLLESRTIGGGEASGAQDVTSTPAI
jgi:hypothetical protein